MTFYRLAYHLIFRVHPLSPLLTLEAERLLHCAATRTLARMGGHRIIINGTENHQHLAIQPPANRAPSELAVILKSQTAIAINRAGILDGHFRWKRGYAILTASPHTMDRLIVYIRDQKIHHSQGTAREEQEPTWEEQDAEVDRAG